MLPNVIKLKEKSHHSHLMRVLLESIAQILSLNQIAFTLLEKNTDRHIRNLKRTFEGVDEIAFVAKMHVLWLCAKDRKCRRTHANLGGVKHANVLTAVSW